MLNANARENEIAKYGEAYASPRYGMGKRRHEDAATDLSCLPVRGSYLDVGCGRGEMLAEAEALGFALVRGIEVVPALIDGTRVVYGEGHALPLPADSFDVVTLFDVIEHVLPGDDEAACRELQRVARAHVLISANNANSHFAGHDLHVNKRDYSEWDRLFRTWFDGDVTRLGGKRHDFSPTWRVDFQGA